jgi:alkylated DNA repair dioxygenase AlkB
MILMMEKIVQLLPHDGIAEYYGIIIPEKESEILFNELLEKINWKNDEAIIFGRHIITKRKVAWYADQNFSYTYSRKTRQALPWIKELTTLKKLSESLTQATFNSCLLNLYHDGNEGVAWHSDDEKTLASDAAIASLSFGAERKFSFRHKKTKQTISLTLPSGSLMVMRGKTQQNWVHSLPKMKGVKNARINLTFRTMISSKSIEISA